MGDRAPESPAVVVQRFDSTPLPTPFVVRLLQRLRDRDPRVTPALVWLDQRLASTGTTADDIVRKEHQRQGGMNVTVSNVINTGYLIGSVAAIDGLSCSIGPHYISSMRSRKIATVCHRPLGGFIPALFSEPLDAINKEKIARNWRRV